MVELEGNPRIVTGTFTWKSLSPDPMRILSGSAQLFAPDTPLSIGSIVPSEQNRYVAYRFDLLATNGSNYHFYGFRDPNSGPASSAFSSTYKAAKSLHIVITRASDDSIVARGVLKVAVRNFLDHLQGFGIDSHSHIPSD